MLVLCIAIGGMIGTLFRWLMSGFVNTGAAGIPRSTLVVNLLGSAILGFAMRYMNGPAHWSPELRAGITIGFCGAFTTMSTFAYELVQLGTAGQQLRAVFYLTATVFGSALAVLAGSALAGKMI